MAVAACTLFTDLGGYEGEEEPPKPDASEVSTTDAPVANETGSDVTLAPKYEPKFKRAIVITNGATTALAADQAVCTIQPILEGAKVRPDFGDVRIFGPVGSERDRIIDFFSTSTIEACFRLERPIGAGSSDTYEVRYGDPNAVVPTNDPAALFAFYDGFDGTSIAPKWAVQGTVTVANGVLVVPKGGENGVRTSAANDGVPAFSSLEMRVRVLDPASAAGPSGYFYWFGYQRTNDFTATSPWTLFIARSANQIGAEQQIESFAADGGTCSQGCSFNFGAQSKEWRVYRIDRGGGTNRFRVDSQEYTAASDNGDLGILIRSYLVTSDIEVDWVRARPIVLPEPTVVFGSESPL